MFKNPTVKSLEIEKISKIEYTELETEADMFLYEIYYINKLKPFFNRDDKAFDKLSVSLPELTFNLWTTSLWEKWKKEITEKNVVSHEEKISSRNIDNERRKAEAMLERGEISREEYEEKNKVLSDREIEEEYKKGKITFIEYCKRKGLTSF